MKNWRDKKGDISFVRRTTWKFCSGGDKMRNASGHQSNVRWKWAAVKKSEREHVRHFLHIKSVSKKFLEVSLCSRAKRQRNVQKNCEVAFLLIRPIVDFYRSPALPSPLSITWFYILFEPNYKYYRELRF